MFDPHSPFAERSALPFELPDYAEVTVPDLEAAIMEGMARQRAEWEAVATDPASPTVANTVVALDGSGDLLERALSVFGTLAASVGGDEVEALQETLSPLLAAHGDLYQLDDRLYRRFLALRDATGMDAETKWTVEQEIRSFEREGIHLNEQQRSQLQQLNAQIAKLETRIEHKITRQLEQTGLGGHKIEDLGGLGSSDAARCRAAGKKRGFAWFIEAQNASIQTEQAVLTEPRVRRALLEASVNRGSAGGDVTDTRAEILQLTQLRDERAHLLGFPDHASAVMDAETARDPEAVRELLLQVGQAANLKVEEQADTLRTLAAADPDGDGLQAADWPYYENILRRDEAGIDAETLRPYLELGRVVEDGVFWAAQQLYGIRLLPREDLRGWHEDVQVWEVQEEDGTPLGLFLADYFNRPGKQGGAWMAEIQAASPGSTLPIVSNDANFPKPLPGQPALLDWDDVETLFHEFGHALHGLFSATTYRGNAGTNVPRDFVELPSQLNEMWAYHPAVLRRFARHHDTGAPLPQKLVTALSETRTFGQAFATAEYVAAAIIDQAWHSAHPPQLPTTPELIDRFEREALEQAGVKNELVPARYHTPYFAHTFAGGYDAGYYAYMWAEMLCAEVEDWFRTAAAHGGDGGLNRQAGETLRRELLSRGYARDPMVSFEAVTGRSAGVESVLRRRGLTSAGAEV